jgi:hypothetical protein
MPINKHSNLLQTFVNYGRKKFYNIGPLHQEAITSFWSKFTKLDRFINVNNIVWTSIVSMQHPYSTVLGTKFSLSTTARVILR